MMKLTRALIIVSLLVVMTNLNGQVLYQQDFENGLGEMISIDKDSLTANIILAEYGSEWAVFPDSLEEVYNSAVAVSNSWFEPTGVVDDWLITPEIQIDGKVHLEWQAVSIFESFRDSYRVLISTTGQDIESFTTVLLEVDEEETRWSNRSIDLSDYEGQAIWLAFQNISNDKYLLALDNIIVRVLPERDASVFNIDFAQVNYGSFSSLYTALNENQSIITSVRNLGTETISSIEIDYAINDVFAFTEKYTVDLQPGENQDLVLPIDIETGIQNYSASITKVNDDDDMFTPNNHFLDDRNINFLPPVPDFVAEDSNGNEVSLHGLLGQGKVVILDFMAAYCGDVCMRSTEKLNRYYDENGSGDTDLEILALALGFFADDENLNSGIIAGWGGTYPKFSVSDDSQVLFEHFDKNHNFGNDQIPFFIMICPNIEDPQNSVPIVSQVGSGVQSDFFNSIFDAELADCKSRLVAVKEIAEVQNIRLFPNPNFSEYINIEIDMEKDSELALSIVNLHGHPLSHIELSQYSEGTNFNQIDISELSSGLYFLRIEKDGRYSNVKFTVIR